MLRPTAAATAATAALAAILAAAGPASLALASVSAAAIVLKTDRQDADADRADADRAGTETRAAERPGQEGAEDGHGDAAEADWDFFQPSDDLMADVDATLAAARASGKLALFILGADWCHDTRALVDRFHQSDEMGAVLEAHYEVRLVDVGYLDRAREVAQRFGLPIYFHTPTVLIVDPETEQLLNADDFHIWRDAYLKSEEETIAYFAEYGADETPAGASPDPVLQNPEYRRLLAEIEAFAEAQGARIARGYEVIGPLLEVRDDALMENWRPLSRMRYALADDLLRLRGEARARIAAGETDITLDFPEYEPLPWE